MKHVTVTVERYVYPFEAPDFSNIWEEPSPSELQPNGVLVHSGGFAIRMQQECQGRWYYSCEVGQSLTWRYRELEEARRIADILARWWHSQHPDAVLYVPFGSGREE